jgi:hypothetical protein
MHFDVEWTHILCINSNIKLVNSTSKGILKNENISEILWINSLLGESNKLLTSNMKGGAQYYSVDNDFGINEKEKD